MAEMTEGTLRAPRLGVTGTADLRSGTAALVNFARRHDTGLALLLYVAAALLFYRSAVGHLASNCTCTLPGDAAEFTWAFGYFPHALLHGQSLLSTKTMWTPTGINLAGATAVPLLAFLLWPVTALWGPIVSYNVVTIAAPALVAWSGYLLIRHVAKGRAASLIAGGIYGFSCYEVAQSTHLQMAVLVCPAIVALCVLRAIEGRVSKRRFSIQLTVLLLVQTFISVEVLFTMTVFGGVALVLGWAFAQSDLRSRIVSVLPPLVIAYAVTLLLSSVYLYQLLKAPNYAKDVGVLFYETDVLAFLVPTTATWIGGSTFAPVSGLFQAGPGETVAYLGLPLVLIAGRYAITRWHDRLTRFLAILIAVGVFWVLGSHLYVSGKPTIWLPYSIVAGLPGFNSVMQGRVAIYVTLLFAMVLALWLSKPRTSGGWRAASWVCAAAALAFVIPNFAHPVEDGHNTWTNPVFFKTHMYERYLHRGETIMPIIWGGFSESPLWQAEDDFYWNMANGYFLPGPPAGWSDQLTNDLWTDTPTSADSPLLGRFIRRRGVSDVVVQDDALATWSPMLRQAGLRPDVRVGGVTIYHVPARMRDAGSAA
jgi:hypothetical protein